MHMKSVCEQRRTLLRASALAAATTAWPLHAHAQTQRVALQRAIPTSGEKLPVIGMGTWLTFDVSSSSLRAPLNTVLQHFFAGGGAVIDSSPMYGAAEETIGVLMPGLGIANNMPNNTLNNAPNNARGFSATKVWTIGRNAGITQMQRSFKLWGVQKMDLVQIHNMLDWKTQLETLKAWKSEGRIRYIGITTSHGRRHDEFEAAMKRERFDFVQFTYNLADRSVEQRLLLLAADRGAAVLINRPFDGGNLFDTVGKNPVPAWAVEAGIATWAEYFLKWVVAHPAVTCAIPATSQPAHMLQNMRANFGNLPDAALRARMVKHFESF
jgi:diketogulonate reductase-like aldo/keto reductase